LTQMPYPNLLPGFACGAVGPMWVGLMVMIVKGHEKQSRGFISVTRITVYLQF